MLTIILFNTPVCLVFLSFSLSIYLSSCSLLSCSTSVSSSLLSLCQFICHLAHYYIAQHLYCLPLLSLSVFCHLLPSSAASFAAILLVSLSQLIYVFFAFCSVNIVFLWFLFAIFSLYPHSVNPAIIHPSCLPATIILIKLIKKYSPICLSAVLCSSFFFSVCPACCSSLFSISSLTLELEIKNLSKIFYLQDLSHSSTEAV